eukprot:CAMPEP_0117435422 /NCGR_PEP_ID=MMETSP0759-20121206/473_1 /TAXON_ID=63605 /ORGANISM="Percolomonas cosmopolitus, Strain WS" /LENGTH=1077 /DNA_ID=CAMNT_0005226969 /DNA_START=1463 /DNA_END=4696 /DNA_ORIENTATION=+
MKVKRDLLDPKGTKPGGLKVRESKATGTYVEDLIYIKVKSYPEIEKTMDQGTEMRTVRSTKMNDKSSRAHTLIQIMLTQKIINPKKGDKEKFKITKESRINLVDLAGSEKVKHTGVTGAGMAEGIAINKSLSFLGKCITALAEKAQGRGKKIIVPFRESKLTWIMKNSLGGNSKTVMIAAIRPGADYYTESLSTLRYADQAKKIKNKAVVNEDPRDKAIKQLKEEVERLKGQLGSGSGSARENAESGMDMEELNLLREELARSQQIISNLQTSEDDEKQSEEMARLRAAALSASGIAPKFDRTSLPHILNLQEDPQQSGIIAYPIDKIGDMIVGRTSADEKPDIILSGLGIKKQHAKIRRTDDSTIFISSIDGASLHWNGNVVTAEEIELHNNDRLIIGNNHVFKVVNPLQSDYTPDEDTIDWDYAQKEHATAQGHLNTVSDEKQKEMEERMRKMEEEFQRQQREKEEELERKKREMEEEMQRRKAELDQAAGDSAQLKALQEQLAKQQDDIKRKEQEMADLKLKQDEEKKRMQEEKQQQDFNAWLEKRILELLPLIKDANEIAKELGKNYEYELKVIQEFDDVTGAPTSKLGVVNKEKKTGLTTVWRDDDFSDRLFKMKRVYGEYLNATENNQTWEGIQAEDDPFEDENIDEAQTLGHCNILMKSLCYLIDNEFYTDILDMSGSVVGEMFVELIPCDESGDPDGVWDMLGIPEDTNTLDEPPNLIGKKFCFKLRIPHAKGLNKNRCEDAFCRYRLPFDTEWQETNIFPSRDVNPNWNYERLVTCTVTPAFQDFLNNQMLNIEVLAKQVVDESSGVKRKGLKEFRKEAEEMKAARDEAKMNLKYVIEERDDLQQENVELHTELDEVLQELEELQMGFFGDDDIFPSDSHSQSRPQLVRQATKSVVHDDLEKLKQRIVDLENRKSELESEVDSMRSMEKSQSNGAPNGSIDEEALGKRELELQKKAEALQKMESELQRKDAELNSKMLSLQSSIEKHGSTEPEVNGDASAEMRSSPTPPASHNDESTPRSAPVQIVQASSPSLAEQELALLREKNALIQNQLKLEQQRGGKSGVCSIQ